MTHATSTYHPTYYVGERVIYSHDQLPGTVIEQRLVADSCMVYQRIKIRCEPNDLHRWTVEGSSCNFRPCDEDFNFSQWEAQRQEHAAQLTEILAAHLAAGNAVIETLGDRTRAWTIARQQVFLREVATPEYLAQHLVSRWRGFNTKLQLFPGQSEHTPAAGGPDA